MALEQGLFKAMILTSLKHDAKNASEIFQFITSQPYSYSSDTVEYLDVIYDGSIESLRAELTYLRKHGYIKKTNAKRPFKYGITELGKRNQKSPFRFMEVFEERVEKEVKKRTASMEKEIQSKIDAEVKKITAGLPRKNEDEFSTAVQEEVQKQVRNMRVEPDPNQQVKRGSKLYLGYDNEIELNCNHDINDKLTFILKINKGLPTLE